MADFRTIPERSDKADPRARKGAADENFPVASRLLPREIRPHVATFYRFVRLADDIADDPETEPDLKLAHLDALEHALVRGEAGSPYLEAALDLRASLAETGVSDDYARDLLKAFRRDVRNVPCRSWADLDLYCRYSAAPVGRYVLALHGEGADPVPASDALCKALQILNHLQDCRNDWVELGRCYIPQLWFDEAGISPERLVERETDARLRTVLDRVLDETDSLLARAEALPRQVRHRRLRLECAVIVSLARALSARLRRDDPLARRVRLTTAARSFAVLRGLVRGLLVR